MKKKISLFLGLLLIILSINIAYAGELYSVIVVGGEPEGVTAAVSSARNKMDTLLISSDPVLGGTMTLARLNSIDMSYGPQKEILTKGIFEEFLQSMKGDSFDVLEARAFFQQLTEKEKNLTVLSHTIVEKPIFAQDKKTLIGLLIKEKGKERIVYGKRFIDATADADLAAMSGVSYTVGKEDLCMGKTGMAATLVFQVAGVDWGKISAYLNNGEKEYLNGANEKSAWGYGPEMKAYQSLDPQMKLRGLNIGRQNDGSVLINALLIFSINPLDPLSVEQGITRGKKEVKHVVDYLRKNACGFSNAYLVDTAEKLYIRESRHIEGEYKLTLDDVLENKIFDDRIALGSYPVDVQAANKYEWGVSYGVPIAYSIPFRSLVPLNVENLLVVGRSASYTSLAAGSARVIPVGMVEGQSAGYAAAYSIRRNITFRKLTYTPLEMRIMQDNLRNQGVYLPYLHLGDNSPDRGHWSYPYVKQLRSKGLVAGGYENKYNLDQVASGQFFLNLLKNILQTLPDNLKSKQAAWQLVENYSGNNLTYTEAINILNKTYSNYLLSCGQKEKKIIILDEKVKRNCQHKGFLTRGEVIALVCQLMNNVEKQQKK